MRPNVTSPAAKAGDGEAFKKIYMAVVLASMLQAQELKFPIHFHTGITGGLWNGPVANCDPFLLVPILRQPRFLRTRIVLLHAGHPWMQHAGMMAHIFPHVWVDTGWTTPWTAQRIVEVYRDVISLAPLSKIMIGSGGHGSPEIHWLCREDREDRPWRGVDGFRSPGPHGRKGCGKDRADDSVRQCRPDVWALIVGFEAGRSRLLITMEMRH